MAAPLRLRGDDLVDLALLLLIAHLEGDPMLLLAFCSLLTSLSTSSALSYLEFIGQSSRSVRPALRACVTVW